jgi:formate dehydrogenase iron-sulfur subunit
MNIDRRNFMKAMGITGISLAVGKAIAGESDADLKKEIEFHGMLFDATLCIGCRVCEKTCAKVHNLPEPPKEDLKVGEIRKTTTQLRTVIYNNDTSKGEVYAKNQCMHCNEPACAAACLTQAMYKTKEGPVVWRGEKCMGCRYCMVSCPFDVPKFEYNSPNPKIQKCDMCYDRIVQGKIPACAEACGDALIYGTRRELMAEAMKRITENPKDYYPKIYGENIAGGTSLLILSPVPFKELGLRTDLQNSSYPSLSKGFLYSVPAIFVLLPPFLLGIHEATKRIQSNTDEHE